MNNFQFDLFHYEMVTSTNETALELLKCSKAVLPFGVRADTQTAGMGTRGRKWVSPQGNLYVTYCFEEKHKQDISAFSLVVGCSVLQIFEDMQCDYRLRLKWPNDIYCDGRKIGGILITKIQYGDISLISVGIGLNFQKAPIIDDMSYQSGALVDYYSDVPDLKNYADKLGRHLESALGEFQKKGFKPFKDFWNEHAYLINNQVLFVQDNGDAIKGIFKGAHDDGSLIMQDHDKEHYYYSGKIKAA